MYAEHLHNEFPPMTEAEYLAFADAQESMYEYHSRSSSRCQAPLSRIRMAMNTLSTSVWTLVLYPALSANMRNPGSSGRLTESARTPCAALAW